MSKARKVFWLVAEVTPIVRGKAMLLNPHGFEVKFFTSVEEIEQEIRVKRAGIIFISDDGTEFDIEIKIKALAKMPELKGARLMLITQNRHQGIFETAAGMNFRDFIPLDLPNELWIQRIVYSCGGHSQPFIQPAGQVTMNNISALALPARLIWISDTRIRLECRLRPPVGSTLKLSGKLADDLGVKHISIFVESLERTGLFHRFSDAIIGRWKIPTENQKKYQDLIWRMRIEDPGRSYRAFVAAKDPVLRNQLLEQLGRPDFTVNSALQIQSIVTEPKFFTPEIVFIEDVLTSGINESRFIEMLQSLSPNTPVIIIGPTQDSTKLRKRFPDNRLMFLKRMPMRFDQAVLEKVLPSIKQENSEMDLGSTRIPQIDQLSFGSVSIPARLLQAHPKALKIAIPFDIGRFGLAQLSSPLLKKLLGRDAWIKITESYRNPHGASAPFLYYSECILIDSNANDQERMGGKLTDLIRDNFADLLRPRDPDNLDFTSANRTPEFGSLRNIRPQLTPVPALPQLTSVPALAQLTPVAALPHLVRSPITAYASQTVAVANMQEVDLSAEDIVPLDSISIYPDSALHEIEISSEGNLAVFADKAIDIAQNVYDNVTSKNFKRTIIFFAFSAFMLALILAILSVVAENYDHSGTIFTEELYRYAPHLKKLRP